MDPISKYKFSIIKWHLNLISISTLGCGYCGKKQSKSSKTSPSEWLNRHLGVWPCQQFLQHRRNIFQHREGKLVRSVVDSSSIIENVLPDHQDDQMYNQFEETFNPTSMTGHMIDATSISAVLQDSSVGLHLDPPQVDILQENDHLEDSSNGKTLR